MSASEYVPFGSGFSQAHAPGFVPPSVREEEVRNGSGRIALWLGIAALGMMVASVAYPILFALSAILAPTALVFGVRGLVLRSRGRATELAAPLAGVILALVAAALAALAIVSAIAFLATTSSPEDFTPEETSERYPNNPEMAAAYATAYDIQHRLHQLYPARDWPSTLTADSAGAVVLNGETLGTLLPGQTFTYETVDDGRTFRFVIYASVPGEQVSYDSTTEILMGQCDAGDLSCSTDPLE